MHSILLLSDSALPLGSFAFSSGLESYLAHHKLRSSPKIEPSLHHFLELSVSSLASTSLPYVAAAFKSPMDLRELDNDIDASTPCTVTRRASVAQGRAILAVWERAFRTQILATSTICSANDALEAFSLDLRAAPATQPLGPSGHFAPLWGVVCLSMGLTLQQSSYMFLLNHGQAVVSAAVRACVIGPHQAQKLLASQKLQDLLTSCAKLEIDTRPDDARQNVPSLDLWVGRHDLLYTQIFSS